MATHTNMNKNISLTDDICADGICCFMSIPRKQTHLSIWKYFFRRRSASFGVKLLYAALHEKDIVYNPCQCLDFHLKEVSEPGGFSLKVVLRCGLYGKKCRPYACNEFPDKADSFMYDIHAPCVYNEYRANENYMKLKHKHIFRLFYAIKDDPKLLKKIFPGCTAEETRKKLEQCDDAVKVSAAWNEKPSEYFLLEVPRSDTVLYVSKTHPKIESVKQAYDRWQGHIETWLERHYGNTWQELLDRAIDREKTVVKKKPHH